MNRYNHANESAESKITPGAILPSSESAEELIEELIEIIDSESHKESILRRCSARVAAHDAETLRKAAEMVRLSPKRFPHYYHETDEMNTADEAILVEDAIAAILGEGECK